jgi:glycosyltransferase involved in cell wall biosynthesis
MSGSAVLTFFNTISGQYSFWDDFAHMIGRRLRDVGVENICYRRDYNEHAIDPPAERHPTPDGSLGSLKWLRDNVRPVAARFNKVIFHNHGHYQPIFLGREVWHHRRARWFWTEHLIADPGRNETVKKTIRTALQTARLMPYRLYGVSQPGAARLKEQFRTDSVRCIRTGVRLLSGIPPRQPSPAPRKALFVGRLIPEKGGRPLLRAWALLRKRKVDVTLTVVGSGPLQAELQAFAAENGLAGVVEFAGYQKDPAPFYRAADFVVVPSVWLEALGMVSVEARMYGLPVIYSNRGGLPGTQVDGVTGLALREVTPEEIADKVVALVSDPGRYAEMCRRAAQNLEEFSIETMVDSYIQDYLETLASM